VRPPLGSSPSLFLVIVIGGLVGCSGVDRPVDGDPRAEASYVGGAECATCHTEETEAWTGSHHDLAMQEATASTVLGDFDDALFTSYGSTTTFTKRGEVFVIRTEGPDGVEADYDVSYVFGVDPLQQYLIELDRGRYQAFTVAWDSRPEEEGGQRWFHLYPDDRIEPGDRLHWTAPSMTWNWMCAECHSTDLRRNFDLETLTYSTTWSDMDVSCESCHGPGSLHVELASSWTDAETTGRPSEELGLSGAMAHPGGGWVIDPGETIARRTSPIESNRQVESCAHCHARRATIEEGRVAGTSIHDSDIVSRLVEGLYYPDGQILEEVYVYGSFVQSKMYAAGVRCSDCHEPHSLRLRAEGNGVCATCHLPTAYDTTEHHNHPAGSSGAECVACHMPSTTYMGVDPRQDHSMRIPRPHLTDRLGVPNACSRCHERESVAWAIEAVERWYGEDAGQVQHFGEVLDAGRAGLPGSATQLRDLAASGDQSAIVRATALALTAADPSASTLQAIEAGSVDPDPFVRLAAIAALEGFPPDARLRGAFRLLRDSIRAVRTEAARVLSPISVASLTPAQQSLLGEVVEEYVATQMVNVDHPSAHVNVANVRAQQGDPVAAEIAYRDAIRVDPGFIPAYLNLSDLYRALGRDGDARATLEEGLRIDPEEAALHHSMGLVLVRLGESGSAVEWLARAVELAPEAPRFAYVLGVALNSTDDSDAAIGALTTSLTRHPYDRDLLTLLALLHRDRGERAAASGYAERLLEVAPDDQAAAQLLADLRRSPD
jgi:Tfp pilus assembly protein PilF